MKPKSDSNNTAGAVAQERLIRRFRFHWRDGKKEEANGDDVAKAFAALGYGGGAISALDYYEEISSTNEKSDGTAGDGTKDHG